ncbi:hypothetical protein JCM10295v2_004924 [Rhodotorula toruloides]
MEAWREELAEELKPRIVRLVAETSRLLLHLNHLPAFTDLDRAFFSSKLGGYGRSLRRALARGEKVVEGKKLPRVSGNPLRMGKGLGWERGQEDVAWMVAFEAALREGRARGGKGADERAVEKFGRLVRAVRGRGGEGGKGQTEVVGEEDGRNGQTAGDRIDSHLLAFLTRIMSRVHARLGTPVAGDPSAGRLLALDEVDSIVEEIRLAEADEGEEVVSMALLESAMSGLEEQASASPPSFVGKSTPVSVDHPLFRKIEEDIEILVARLDNTDSVLRRSKSPKNSRLMRDRHAHILYTTIRFLILRARISRSRSSSRHSLLSASQLYSILLGLSKSSSSRLAPLSSASIARLRVWQSSALIRLVWALMPASSGPKRKGKDSPVSFLELGDFDRETATRILDLLDLTRAAVADISPPPRSASASTPFRHVRDPRLVGISSSFLRTFLETLAKPFAPQPSAPPHHSHSHQHHSRRPPHAFTPTHDLLDRTLHTILSLRTWDSSLPSPIPRHSQTQVDHHAWEYRLFSRPSSVIHLVRGWVLAPSPSAAEGGQGGVKADERDHLIPRLSSLLSLLTSLVRLPPNSAWPAENATRLAVDVEWAVWEVVERQWGWSRRARGEEGWREEVGRVVGEWKVEMREVEEERRTREEAKKTAIPSMPPRT